MKNPEIEFQLFTAHAGHFVGAARAAQGVHARSGQVAQGFARAFGFCCRMARQVVESLRVRFSEVKYVVSVARGPSQEWPGVQQFSSIFVCLSGL